MSYPISPHTVHYESPLQIFSEVSNGCEYNGKMKGLAQ